MTRRDLPSILAAWVFGLAGVATGRIISDQSHANADQQIIAGLAGVAKNETALVNRLGQQQEMIVGLSHVLTDNSERLAQVESALTVLLRAK